jgi:hypothetical protein
MAHAFVQDVAASWEQYERVARGNDRTSSSWIAPARRRTY